MWRQLEENNDTHGATLEEHREMFEKEESGGFSVSVATMSRAAVRKKLADGLSKKRSLGASERDEQRRDAFREHVRST